jgi:hypothetical protein
MPTKLLRPISICPQNPKTGWYASDFDENISTTSVVLSHQLRVSTVRVPVMTNLMTTKHALKAPFWIKHVFQSDMRESPYIC